MIPVAIILAVIVGYGAKQGIGSENINLGVSRGTEALADRQEALLGDKVRRNETSTVTAGVAIANGPTEFPEFISRKKFSQDVPYYTTADVMRANGKTAPEAQKTDKSPQDGVIIINEASPEVLEKIPGIGETKALMIAHRRPTNGYRSWEELDALPGIGPATIKVMQEHAELERR